MFLTLFAVQLTAGTVAASPISQEAPLPNTDKPDGRVTEIRELEESAPIEKIDPGLREGVQAGNRGDKKAAGFEARRSS